MAKFYECGNALYNLEKAYGFKVRAIEFMVGNQYALEVLMPGNNNFNIASNPDKAVLIDKLQALKAILCGNAAGVVAREQEGNLVLLGEKGF